MTDQKFSYVLVGNIPSKFHSVDLRSFFSQFIETEKFDCFHFRHRPEVLKRKIDIENGDINSEILTNDVIKGKTTCCVVRLKKGNVKELLEIYDGENWTNKDGKLCAQKAVISRIIIKNVELSNGMYKTRKEQRDHTREKIEFIMDDLLKLSELHPPSFMPNGNIGTSLTTFMSLIRTCRLPPHVIKKLGLSFPSSRSKHCYGNVRFDYGNNAHRRGISLCPEDGAKDETESVESEEISIERMSIEHTLLGPSLMDNNEQNITPNNLQNTDRQNTDKSSPNIKVGNQPNTKFDTSKSSKIASDNEQDSNRRNVYAEDREPSSDTESEPEEDWERHEALYDDVDCQGRTKERLFENKIELKWEKGGSGLVFYTDAAYWESLSGDFDEQTADDWDIDMRIYEKGGYGDRHSKALMDMRIAEQRRLDIDNTPKIGDFEKHTKGFGSKVMKSQGWTEGSSLGSSQVGITEPVPSEGQLPYCKTGVGYYGEKLDRHIKRRRVDKEVLISTVFDKTANEKVSTPKQSAGPFVLKYRRKMPDFVRQEDKTV